MFSIRLRCKYHHCFSTVASLQRKARQVRMEEQVSAINGKVKEDLRQNPSLKSSQLYSQLKDEQKYRELLMSLEVLVIRDLQRLAKSCGGQLHSQVKAELLDKMKARIELAKRIYSGNPQNANSAVFIDVGVKNMAWLHFDMEKMAVLQFGCDDLSRFGSVEHASGAEFATVLHGFLEELRHRCGIGSSSSSALLHVIEQQMSRHNPKCSIIEAQLHAFLYPNTTAISAFSVSSYFGISTLPKQIISSSNTADSDSEKLTPSTRYSLKKKFGVMLVESWIREGIILSQNETLSRFYSPICSETKETKRDDLSDCILNAVAYSIWSRKFNDQMLSIVRGEYGNK